MSRFFNLIRLLIFEKKLLIIEIIFLFLISQIKFKFLKKEFFINKKKRLYNYPDYFSHNKKIWSIILKKFKKKKIEYLEIGCFEGRSVMFVLDYLKKVNCTIVDNFNGGAGLSNKTINQEIVYKNLIHNLEPFKKKIFLNKMYSKQFFKQNKKTYDLIYIDGSHKAKDIFSDGTNAERVLNKNGLIIFDDVLKIYKSTILNSPILALAKLYVFFKNKKFKFLFLGDQLIVSKN